MKHKNAEKINEECKCENTMNCNCEQSCEQTENTQCHCAEGNKCNCDEKCECSEKEKQEEDTIIAKLEEENKQLIEKVKLAQAELINYRRRKDDEMANLLKYANQDLIMELITLVDNFERAIKLDDNDLTDELSKFLAGFKMMYASLTETLKKFGVEEINRAGQIFDPSQEQALMTDHVEGLDDDVVIEVLLKGYKLKDRVIRPASVKINQN